MKTFKLINHVPIYQSETSTGGTATGAAQIVFQLMLLAELMTVRLFNDLKV